MAVITQRTNLAPGLGTAFGEGLTQGYEEEVDRRALQNAIGRLPPNASPQEILKTLVGTKASPGAKQEVFKNLMGAAEFEQKQKQFQQQQEAKVLKDLDKKGRAENESSLILQQAGYPKTKADELATQLTPQSARTYLATNKEPSEYEIAQNQAKRFDPVIKDAYTKALEAEKVIPITETAIYNNENYGDAEKWWDTAIDSIDSKFLNSLKSKTGQELEAYAPVAVQGVAGKMSGVLTVGKQKLIEKKIPSIGRDKNANRMALYLNYVDLILDQSRARIINDIISENKYGLAPKDLDKQIDERMLPLQQLISKDVDVLLKNGMPSLISLKQQLEPGETLAVTPEGDYVAITLQDLNKPQYKNYKRIEL